MQTEAFRDMAFAPLVHMFVLHFEGYIKKAGLSGFGGNRYIAFFVSDLDSVCTVF